MTREEIEKKMHKAAEEIKPLVTTLVEALCEAHQKGYLAGVELGVKMTHPHWIPVEERKPQENQRVRAWSLENNEEYLCDYHDGIFEDFYGSFTDGVITHWMEIVPPQGKEE